MDFADRSAQAQLGLPAHEAHRRPVSEIPVPDRDGILIGRRDPATGVTAAHYRQRPTPAVGGWPNYRIERMTLLTGMFSKRVACALALAMTLGVGVAHAQEARIAAVNSDRILRESAAAKAAQVKLEAEFAKRDKDIADMAQKLKTLSDSLDKNGASMSVADRAQKQRDLSQLDTDFQRKQREFREDLNQRRNEELAAVLDRANKVIKQIAEQQHYDLIVQEAVYVSPRIDITDQVLKALAASGN
ncbi:outer membrane protein [Paraburkholderia bryophila]|uniref:Outer membrane protein n=1 Tax=Paraburkholderia bryophila TaxID=420952 RepID=A0A7Y9WIG6_9BURK|nr:outer membrane protein [Paraburkholderia bryophila]